MKLALVSLLVALAVFASEKAQANTYYYLVGMRHDYRLSSYPDRNASKRAEIEEAYANELEIAQRHLDETIQSATKEEGDGGGQINLDPRDDAQREFEMKTVEAAEKRDDQLGQIYELDDSLQQYYPELRQLQDGPYELVCLATDSQGQIQQVQFYPYAQGFTGPNAFGITGSAYYLWKPYSTYVTEYYQPAKVEWIEAGSPSFRRFHRRRRPDLDLVVMVRPEMVLDRSRWGNDGKPTKIEPSTRADLVARVERYQAYLGPSSTQNPELRPRSAFTPFTPQRQRSVRQSSTRTLGTADQQLEFQPNLGENPITSNQKPSQPAPKKPTAKPRNQRKKPNVGN